VLGYGNWKVVDRFFFGKLGKGIKTLQTQKKKLIKKPKISSGQVLF
jgi:hypothetical protein